MWGLPRAAGRNSMFVTSTAAAEPMARTFVHTHVHSDYSLIDGAAKVKDLVDAAVRCEQPALARVSRQRHVGGEHLSRALRPWEAVAEPRVAEDQSVPNRDDLDAE